MDEIVRELPVGARVLDLGCGRGSFSAGKAVTVRLDRERHAPQMGGYSVQADASQLPFSNASFQAIISNHSLEHVDNLIAVLDEMARVVRRDGCLYVAVPNAATFSDRLYRWIYHGGGHVNAFRSAPEVAALITASTGLPLVATRLLYSSFAFLQRKHFQPRPPRRLWLVGGGYLRWIAIMTYALRVVDKWTGMRWTEYGWALYFGRIPGAIETERWRNVCVGCGVAASEAYLRVAGRPVRKTLFLESYNCQTCGAWNLLTKD